MMLRAVWLTIGKEFLLIRRDRVGLFMLLVAPIAVIAAAGFSLAKIYGGRTAPRGEYSVAILDEDHGAVARAILDAIAHRPELSVIHASSRLEAQQSVREQKLAVVAIVIAPGTTDAIEHGHGAQLILYTDAVKYLQTTQIELTLSELCRKISAGAAAEARRQAAEQTRNLSRQLEQARESAEQARAAAARLAAAATASRAALAARIRAQLETALSNARAQTKAALDAELNRIQRKIGADAAAQQAKLEQLEDYLKRLEIAHGQFETWFGRLKQLAGSHAADIPPPPAIPTLPADLDLGAIKLDPGADLKNVRATLESALTIAPIDLNLPERPTMQKTPPVNIPVLPRIDSSLAIPGTLGYVEVDLTGRENGAVAGFNAFDLHDRKSEV